MLPNGDQDPNQRPNKNPLYRPKMVDVPSQRKDGWMEVQLWATHIDEPISINIAFDLTCNEREQLTGLILHDATGTLEV